MKLILQIALGVSLGVVLGGGLLYLYTGGFAEHIIGTALKQASVQNASVTPKVETPKTASVVDDLLAGNVPAAITPSLPVAPKPIVPATPQQISVTPQTNQANQSKPIAEITVAGKTISEFPSASTEEQQKAAKFKAYYKKSEKCKAVDHDNHDSLVDCGNEYIRAKAKFEELWQQGKFKD